MLALNAGAPDAAVTPSGGGAGWTVAGMVTRSAMVTALASEPEVIYYRTAAPATDLRYPFRLGVPSEAEVFRLQAATPDPARRLTAKQVVAEALKAAKGREPKCTHCTVL